MPATFSKQSDIMLEINTKRIFLKSYLLYLKSASKYMMDWRKKAQWKLYLELDDNESTS